MARLNIEERVANIERHLFGFSYEEAEPIYASMMETIKSIDEKPSSKTAYLQGNKDLFAKLESVLGIKSP